MKKLTPYEYTKKYYKVARYVEKKTGVPWSMIVAAGAYESGWDEKRIGNNAFGIKYTDGWKGDKIYTETTEEVNGVDVSIKDWFRNYPTVYHAFRDYARVIVNHYGGTLPKLSKYDLAMNVGLWYATGTGYGSKLVEIMKMVEKEEKNLIKNDELPKGIYIAPTSGNISAISAVFVLLALLFYILIKL